MKILALLLLTFTSCAHGQDVSYIQQEASFSEPKRLLLLDGDDGAVACRIYGSLMSGTLPRLSDGLVVEGATRSFLRMKNLTAVRGIPGSSMVGPMDYFGNLERPHEHLYTIDNAFPPVVHRQPVGNGEVRMQWMPFDNRWVTAVKARWIRGDTDSAKEKGVEYSVTSKHLRQSLFLFPGFLEIDREQIVLQPFDPRGVDLSSFKARLVANDQPFQITQKPLRSNDDYRLITYMYEPGYAGWQVEHGSGLFLEKHAFSQTITPIDPEASGFVALARMNDQPDELEIIAVEIPYGYTLIIDEGCIHGDTTLNGFFMMGMTSDHTTMRTADTVFLKNPQTKRNVGMTIWGRGEFSPGMVVSGIVPAPYVVYKGETEAADREQFKRATQGKNFIFNPLSSEYRQRLWGLLGFY